MAGDLKKTAPTVLKKIKVENWSSFLLQKLYHCYTQKKDCDFTLKMVDGNLKVHSVVMNACSNYFIQINLENSHTLSLPPPLRKELMEPIVNFIYSGVLTFKSSIQKDLVTASKILEIDILTKLIDTEQSISDNKTYSNKTVPFADAHIKQRHYLSSGSDTPSPSAPPPLKSVLKATPTPLKSTPTVIKSIGNTPSSNVSSPRTPSTPNTGAGKMAMKKLPFWRKRTTIPSSTPPVPKTKDPEDIKPTRFELPDDSMPNSSYFYVPNFENPLSYESECMLKSDEKILKRVTQPVAESMTESKKMKLIKSVVGQEEDSQDNEEILPDDDFEHDDESYENSSGNLEVSKNSTPKPILKTDRLDSSQKKSVRFSTPSDVVAGGQATLTPLTETPDNDETNGTEEEPMVTTQIVTIKQEVSEDCDETSQQSTANKGVTMGSDGSIHMSLSNPNALASIDPNHAKIIGEVLQKYPDLVTGNRNFKLKVVNSENQIINYIMYNKQKLPSSGGSRKKKLNSSSASNGIPHGSPPKNTNVDQTSTPAEHRPVLKPNSGQGQKPFPGGGLESTVPRSFDCKYCGPNCEPLNDYYTWRIHMTKVHGEKFDVRICEYCGLKLSKRNLYLYHLLRVHNVKSDAMKFPECSFCNYIALTENLLYKHCKNIHSKLIGFMCHTCNIMFNTNALLVEHMHTMGHGSAKKSHECPFCQKTFDRSVNLKAHLRANHNDREVPAESAASLETRERPIVVKEEMVGQEPPESYEGYNQYIEVPVMQNAPYGTLVLPGGVTIIDTNNTRMAEASSHSIGMESEGMIEGTTGTIEPNEAVLGTNELGQTVLILNGTQQYILEQQADGRLVLPDILANNCVISYADDGQQGGLEQSGGEYEIINVEQAQQEVMMSGQGILVQESSGTEGGQTIYGSHAGETILSSHSRDHSTAPASLVLTSSPYPVLQGHMTSAPMIQTIITTSTAPALSSSVIQSTNPSSAIHQHIMNTSRSQPIASAQHVTSQPIATDPLATEDPSAAGTLENHSADGTLTTTAMSDFNKKSDMEFESADYQDGYDSEGGMVIDAPSEEDHIEEGEMGGEDSSQYEEPCEATGQYEEANPQYDDPNAQYDEADTKYEDAEVDAGEDIDAAANNEVYGTDVAAESTDTQEMESKEFQSNSDPSSSDSTNGPDNTDVRTTIPLAAATGSFSSPLDPLRRSLAAGAEKIQALGSAVQATVRALEDDWGDNLEEEDEEEGDEEQVGPSRGEI